MPFGPDWRAVDLPEIDTLPSPVFYARSACRRGTVFAAHPPLASAGVRHRRRAAGAGARHLVRDHPEQAVWLPTGVLHATGALHDAEFRSLCVDAALALDMPEHCQVLAATRSLRALIVELDAIGQRQKKSADYTARVQQLIVDQLPPAPAGMHLRGIKKTAAAHPVRGAVRQPPTRATCPPGRRAGRLGARTLSRRFERELGISLRDWRTRLRLIRALEWLGAGRAVTDVALELGYASPRRSAICSARPWGAA